MHETVTANMAQAATIHAIERALDVTRFVMLPIGGAGPVHACGMAAKMSIDRLICPTGAGVASAVGMLSSAISFEVARAAPMTAENMDFQRLAAMVEEMDAEASDLVTSAGVAAGTVTRRLSAMMRYVGQGYEIEAILAPETIRAGDKQGLLKAFNEAYRRRSAERRPHRRTGDHRRDRVDNHRSAGFRAYGRPRAQSCPDPE